MLSSDFYMQATVLGICSLVLHSQIYGRKATTLSKRKEEVPETVFAELSLSPVVGVSALPPGDEVSPSVEVP